MVVRCAIPISAQKAARPATSSMGVPNKDKPHVREFCREISDGAEPVYLDTPAAQEGVLDCFVNVEKRIAESGGSVQYGWRIWEWSNTMIEGEFHAVWVSPEGTLST